jgi:hypothetical protein
LAEVALTAAARGWPVFPLAPGAKVPKAGFTDWERHATTNPDRIGAMWAHRPWNVGLACGPAGLVVVDLDVPKPASPPPPAEWSGLSCGAEVFAALAARHNQPWPDTYTVATPSGGLHLYFTRPTDRPGLALRNTHGNTGRGLGWLIDTRAAGGYVAAAGSIINRRRYQVTNPTTPAVLPGWLATLLTPAPTPDRRSAPVPVTLADTGRATRYLRAALDRETRRVLTARPGARNHNLYIAAIALGQLVAGGNLTEPEVRERLEHCAVSVGLTPTEAARTITSGLRTGANRPRTVPA